jgi:hypothetical protein
VDALHKTAQRLVAQVFFAPILKQMHDSPFRSDLLDGGRGGQAFSQLHDQYLIDRLARVSGQRLTRSLVRKLDARRAYRSPTNSDKAPPEQAPEGGSPTPDQVRIHVAPGLRA